MISESSLLLQECEDTLKLMENPIEPINTKTNLKVKCTFTLHSVLAPLYYYLLSIIYYRAQNGNSITFKAFDH